MATPKQTEVGGRGVELVDDRRGSWYTALPLSLPLSCREVSLSSVVNTSREGIGR